MACFFLLKKLRFLRWSQIVTTLFFFLAQLSASLIKSSLSSILEILIFLNLPHPIQLLELSFLKFWEERYHLGDERKSRLVPYGDENIVDGYLFVYQDKNRP